MAGGGRGRKAARTGYSKETSSEEDGESAVTLKGKKEAEARRREERLLKS